MNLESNPELDTFAFALVIHIWQLVCLRLIHGTYPDVVEPRTSLSSSWASYFNSACSLVGSACHAHKEQLKYAVEYWEERLAREGGNRFEIPWVKHIKQRDQGVAIYRNDVADRYLEVFEKYECCGLADLIIQEEAKGPRTQIRDAVQVSPLAKNEIMKDLMWLLRSMDPDVLKAIIQGQLPEKFFTSETVHEELKEIDNVRQIQPGTYMNSICDYRGASPSPTQWRAVCELMLEYVQLGPQFNKLAEIVDQLIHPKVEWPRELSARGLRRYTEWRSHTREGSNMPDTESRDMVKYFVDQLRIRIQGHQEHAPLLAPVVNIGVADRPQERFKQHRHHENSNCLMNLAEAIFQYKYPCDFRLQQIVIFVCFQPRQTWLSEIVLTQLAQGYIEGGGGSSHETAGHSNTSSHREVSARDWEAFAWRALASGKLEERTKAAGEKLDRIRLESAETHRIEDNIRKAHLDSVNADIAMLDAELRLLEAWK